MARFEFLQWLVTWLLANQELEFIWDQGNESKSAKKHEVTVSEAEQVFLNRECLAPLGIQVSPQSDE